MRQPRTLDARLVPVALGVWLGTFAALTIPDVRSPGGWHAALAAGVIAFGVAVALRGPRRARHSAGQRSTIAIGLAIGLGCGVAGAHVFVAARGAAAFTAAATPGTVVTVDGLVRTDPTPVAGPQWAGERYRTLVDLSRACVRKQCAPTRETLVLIGPAGDLRAGQKVRARGPLRATDVGQEASALLFARDVHVLAEPGGIYRATDSIRRSFRDVTGHLSAQGRGLVPGIAIGDTRDLPPELDEAMKTASLTHLTAVSGAHIVIVLAAVVGMCAVLPRQLALPLGLATLAGMYVLVGPMPSIQRAAVMGTVVLLARHRGRAANGLSALAIAVVVNLLIWPYSARSYGFALSVSATAALLLVTAPATRALERVLPGRVARAVAVPLAAQLACAPLIALLAGQFQLYSVIANLLAAPAFAPALLMAMPAALLAPVAPGLSLALARGAQACTAWLAGVAETVAALPNAAVAVPGGAGGVMIVAAGCVAVLAVIVVAARSRRRPTRRVLALAGLAAAAILAVAVAVPRLVPTAGRDWVFWQCDVGQGAALLAKTGAGEAIVVDAGPDSPDIARCLERAGVRNVKVLLLSHPHADHVGGLRHLLGAVRVERIITGPGSFPRPNVADVARAASERDVPSLSVVDSVDALGGTVGDVRWEIWAPSARLAATHDTEEGANDLSLVVYLEARGVRVLAPGDIELDGQRDLLRRMSASCPAPGCLGIDVLVMAHHGSARQDPDLARYLSAPVVLVSSGAGNDYGHPATEALQLYEGAGGRIFRTDQLGDISIIGAAQGVVVTGRGRS